MLSLIEIFAILIIHWVADFVLQTHKQAVGKSKNWSDLLGHTFTYSITWLIPIILFFPNNWTTSQYVLTSLLFGGITFVFHTITDYFTSRLNSYLWAKGNIHNFFVSIGFDQILHSIIYNILLS